MSTSIKFHNGEEMEQHDCESRRDGDWIVFKCPKCDYSRRVNWKTGEMSASGGNMFVMHRGQHFPTGVDPRLMNMN